MIIKMNTWLNSEDPIILPNPNRDFTINPISDVKVEGLKASVQATDFWDNLMARPVPGSLDERLKPGQTVKEYLASLPADYVVDFPVECCYGHNRIAALNELNWEQIDIPVKDVSNENMLLMMAHENRGDWQHAGILVMIETVRKVRDSIMVPVQEYDTFEDYLNAGNTFFRDQQAWKNARAQGIGYRKVLEVLGSSWTEGDVRPAVNAIDMVDDGIYTLTDIGSFPSVGSLRTFNTLAKNIRENAEWPHICQDDMISECANIIKDPDAGATMKNIKLAAGHAKQGNNPVVYLQKGKPQPFNVSKAIESLIVESKLDVRSLPGMGEFEELIQKVEGKIEARGMNEQTSPETTTIDPDTGEEVPAADGDYDAQSELEEAVYGAEGDSGDGGGEADEGGFQVEEDDPNEIFCRAFTVASESFTVQAERLMDVVSELEDDKFKPFFEALDKSFNTLSVLVISAYGVKDAHKMIDEMAEKLAK